MESKFEETVNFLESLFEDESLQSTVIDDSVLEDVSKLQMFDVLPLNAIWMMNEF